MSSIKILPSQISDQIAAGEVVERPASVVKELIENALDAGAQNIEIKIENGGKTFIEVVDDGRGMSREDASKCILRHATSKIQTIDDLFQIRSFGFRGEALAAISAVSKFELLTKTNGSIGTKIKVFGGGKPDISEHPANQGTIITIRDLFCTTPARLNYLKTNETENRAILQEIQNFALAHPDKSFQFFKDGKLSLDFPHVKNKKTRIEQVLKNLSNDLLPISGTFGNTKISGFISTPGQCIASRRNQFLFVNGRAIQDHRINFAVREAFVQSTGIEKHLHPVFVLFIDIDPILVDVNVHPRKLEVKFSEPQEIFSFVKKSILSALSKSSHQYSSPKVYTPSIHPKFTPQTTLKSPPQNTPQIPFYERNIQRQQSDFFSQTQPEIPKSHSPLHLIGQVANKYIVAESEEGMYLFDQHALHERQRFEKLWNEWKNSKSKIQKLLTPQTIHFPENLISLLYENRNVLIELGFSVTFSQDDQVTISEVPQIFSKTDLSTVFEDLLEYLQKDMIGESSSDILMRKLLEYKSCRGAIKFGDKLHTSEMQKLLEDFHTTEWRNLCPHGRPNHIFFPFKQLDQEFHR